MPLDPRDLADIGADLERLAELLRHTSLRLPGPAKGEFEAERDETLLMWDGYLEPRLGAPDRPVVAAIVGPSGSGKSTLINSLAQNAVSATGVIRPTTSRPVVWAADSPEAVEVVDEISGRLRSAIHRVHGQAALTEHLTMIDTPALDRFGPDEVAAQAVAIADICIFVTTPTRYADGLAWRFLKRTRRRGIPILFVVNRLPADYEEQGAILDDFALRLHERELLAEPDPSLLFGLPESPLHPQLRTLAPDAVVGIYKELAEVVDPTYRSGLIDETVYATARMVAERARALTRPMAVEHRTLEVLMDSVAASYEAEAALLDAQLRSGLTGPLVPGNRWESTAADLAGMITRRAGSAAHSAATEWSSRHETEQLVAADGIELWRHGRDTATNAQLALDAWRDGLRPLAETHAKPYRLRWFGAGERAVEALWRAAVQGDLSLSGPMARKFPEDGAELVATARAELSESMRRALASDAERFTNHLGKVATDDLYSLIIDQADRVDAELDALAAQISSAWVETPDEAVEVVAGGDDRLAVDIRDGEAIVELGGPNVVVHRIEKLHPRPVPGAPEGGEAR